jgi:hypothetical protein
MFLVTSSSQSARIGLRQGKIVHIALRRLQGLQALIELASAGVARLQFSPGVAQEPQPELPDTQTILAALGDSGSNDGASLDDEALRLIQEELLEILGPFADVLIDENRACRNLDELLPTLAKQIADPAEAAQFEQRARARLQQR